MDRGHGDHGAGDPPPPPRDLGSGHRGSLQPRRGRGGGRSGATVGVRKEVRSVNKNVKLKKAVDDFGPQLLELDFKDMKTLYPVGKTAAWFANFVGELIREIPLCYESWPKIELEKRAHMFPRIEEMFDLGPLRRSEKWGTIQAVMNEYFANRYRDNKSTFKATHFLNRGGYDAVDEIRRNPPPNMELSMWEKYIEHYMDEKHVKRAAINKENRKKNKVHSRHGSRSLAASRHRYFETSETQEYPSLIHSYYDQRCKNREWMQYEARVNYISTGLFIFIFIYYLVHLTHFSPNMYTLC